MFGAIFSRFALNFDSHFRIVCIWRCRRKGGPCSACKRIATLARDERGCTQRGLDARIPSRVARGQLPCAYPTPGAAQV
ncbi:hypothetical protein EXIGLDRAFT_50198 [Exidia glandulosa HHB12029]|uniref:Uncharacterized protein n=1 Tax=Exidia glandulosa HHB12029 TaxID=1314781 RepID=A0A165IGK7_EXIGL|nr:hypothetical protein EXIGLDRAFT_50198 [Exidia glandulosa HHB12029]